MLATVCAVKMRGVDIPPPRLLMERIAALPAAAPLLARLEDRSDVYLVGGAVRDLLLGGSPVDLDVAVEGDALALARRLGGDVRSHGRFGTGTVVLDGVSYDFAATRRERYAAPGALPDVSPAPLAQDLSRRDFTVNAFAVPLGGQRAGEVIAVAHGLEDLSEGRLRVLHDRSFLDDPTRLLRMARYAARLGFVLEERTAEWAQAAVDGGALTTVSGDRVGAEVRLAAREPDPIAALEWLRRLGLDRAIAPQFAIAFDPVVTARALALAPEDGRRDRVVLASALRGPDAAAVAALLERLGFCAADRDGIVAAATGADGLAARLSLVARPSEIAAAVGGAPVEAVALAGALGAEAPAARWLSELRHVRPLISGDDLLAAGVPAGPAIGRGLRAALAAKLDGRAPDRDAELGCALAAARGQDAGRARE